MNLIRFCRYLNAGLGLRRSVLLTFNVSLEHATKNAAWRLLLVGSAVACGFFTIN